MTELTANRSGRSASSPVARLRAAPTAASLAVGAALVALYAASILLVGQPFSGPGVRDNLVFTAVLVFTLWAGLREPALVVRDLSDLRPLLGADDRELATVRAGAQAGSSSRRATALGAAVGLGIFALGRWVAIEVHGQTSWATVHSVWTALLLVALFALMGQRAGGSISLSRLFSRLGRESREVRLLDPVSVRPFARVGMRSAAYWFVGSAIASLLFVEGSSDLPITGTVIAATLGLGVVTLLMPCVGIHRRLREEKEAELARVRAAIERRAGTLLTSASETSDPGLASLIAYESRISEVREWPFDAPTLGRFVLFFLIPLGSWVGGAMVERVVDWLLG